MNVRCRFRAIVAAGLLWALISAVTAKSGGVSNPAAPAETGTYVFLPKQSTLVQTGGIAGVHWTYSVAGQFQLVIDRDTKTASFTHVDANATDANSPQRTLDPNQAFNLTLLVGTTVDDQTISFTGKAPDSSDIRITVTLQEPLVRLVGQTTPPPGGRDFFSYSLDAVAQRKYSGGTGEPNAPYQIATAADLMTLGETSADYDKHFLLTADIDLDPNLPGRKVFDKAVIAPDMDMAKSGFQGAPFRGVLDGNGHTISNFTQVSTDADYAGLFAYLDGLKAEVKNLGLIAPHVETQTAWCVGALVGRLDQGTVANCYVCDGNVSGRTYRSGQEDKTYGGLSYAGGLVGISNGAVMDCQTACMVFGSSRAGGLAGISIGAVINCTSSGNVSGNMSVGGLVGWNSTDGEIIGCSATGNVSARGAYAGGLVGENMARITNSCARGSVTGDSIVGGLAGSNGHMQTWDIYSETPGEIINSYSTGVVSGTSDVGGLVGLQKIGPVISSFWDIQTSGWTTSAVGVGKATIQMRDIQTYLDAGWDFVGEIRNGTSEIWQMPQDSGYPILARLHGYAPPQLTGAGTKDDPYLIASAMELGAVVHYSSSAHYRLTASFDLSGIRWAAAVVPWLGGTFDGNGHTISYLTIRGGGHLGLFGQVRSGAEVRNLGVVDTNLAGSTSYVGGLVAVNGGVVRGCHSTGAVSSSGIGRRSYVGGLVGSNSGAVTQCRSTAMVNGTSAYVGGLAGDNGGTVTECCSTGAVSTTGAEAGGLVGCNYVDGIVTQCYSSSTVSGGNEVGGLAGGNSGVLSQCYATGVITGRDNVGGLAGRSGNIMSQCYSTGAVNGTSNAGGLVGSVYRGSVTACFWDTQTSGQGTSAAGTGKTTAQMHMAWTFVNTGWDFAGETANGTEDIWWIDEGKDYPRLWWEARN